MTNQAGFFKIKDDATQEVTEYASNEAFAQLLDIRSNGKLTDFMHELHRKYKDDHVNKVTNQHISARATVNFDPNEDQYVDEDGKVCRKQGIRRDIYDLIQATTFKENPISELDVLDNNDPDIDDFLAAMRKRKLPTATNRDIVSILLPMYLESKQVREKEHKAFKALLQSIVIRKNVDYSKYVNPISIQAFGIQPKKGPEYVTGDSYQDYLIWKANQPGNGSKNPNNGPKGPNNGPKNPINGPKDSDDEPNNPSASSKD